MSDCENCGRDDRERIIELEHRADVISVTAVLALAGVIALAVLLIRQGVLKPELAGG